MRNCSDIRPQPVEINILTDGTAEINFSENITENNKGYEFDMYTLIILSTKDTEKHVKEKSDIYLKIAKENENFRIE